jgi:hypothetical protein
MRAKEIVESWNTGKDLLLENAILVPEVDLAFKEWIAQTRDSSSWMLIGGIVVGYYSRPRTTTDVDVLFGSDEAIPNHVTGFKRTRTHAFTHNKTHVEIEVLSPVSINIPVSLYNEVLASSVINNGVRIPTPSGLVALKIQRGSLQDLADIEAIVNSNEIDVSGFTLPVEKISKAEAAVGIKLMPG